MYRLDQLGKQSKHTLLKDLGNLHSYSVCRAIQKVSSLTQQIE